MMMCSRVAPRRLASCYVMSLLLTITWHSALVSAQECTADGNKCDQHERCATWRTEGECYKNRSYMMKQCPASCALEDAATGIPKKRVSGCEDRHPLCPTWAELGECEESVSDMKRFCAKSCKTCTSIRNDQRVLEEENDGDDGCVDNHENCEFWASAGECTVNPKYMTVNCAKSCKTCEILKPSSSSSTNNNYEHLIRQTEDFGTKQTIAGQQGAEVAKCVEESIKYMNDEKTQQLPKDILEACQNRHENCSFWAVIGECENNKSYMTTNCAPACKTCNLIDIEARCPKLDLEPALKPGDLNKMFQRIIQNAPGNRTDLTDDERRMLAETKTPEYTVHIHSGPVNETITEMNEAMDKAFPPWVVTFENFVTDEECEAMIELGYKYEYKRSEDVGKRKFDGTHDSIKSEKRTSENAWCSEFAGCRREEVPTRLHKRMSEVMGIPPENSEDLQLLKYEPGQFYRTHHDYIPHQVERQCGPRILTFFLYLSDVEEGGGTDFPRLGMTIYPKKGRALLWPSVLNSDPSRMDDRTYHQAQDVVKGVKFAANGWIHLYDYMTPAAKGCT